MTTHFWSTVRRSVDGDTEISIAHQFGALGYLSLLHRIHRPQTLGHEGERDVIASNHWGGGGLQSCVQLLGNQTMLWTSQQADNVVWDLVIAQD